MKIYSFCTETILAVLILSPLFSLAQGSSVSSNFEQQLIAFPQEKIYVHNDKPLYLTGEDIWFRAYLVDHASLIPDTTSRYVYGELVSAADSIVSRVKIRPVEGAYHGHITIPEDLPEGAYDLRFYTRYMENLGEDYFFRKHIYIGDPLSALYRTDYKFTYENSGSVTTEIKFISISSGEPIVPTEVRVRARDGQIKKVNLVDGNILRLKLDPARDFVNNTMYIEYDYDSKFHKEFIPLVPDPKAFDVSFFPEGGNLPAGVLSRVAFKALKSNGLGEVVTGLVVNSKGDTLVEFTSNRLGMGAFALAPRKGETYSVVCKNPAGAEKKLTLPAGLDNAISLQARWTNNALNVGVTTAQGMTVPQRMHIIMHSGGVPVHNEAWNPQSPYIRFDRNDLPSGILHLLLTDDQLNPLSERLVFNINPADITAVGLSTDKGTYKPREQVISRVLLTGNDGQPLKGSFSVSVTDDKDITPDSTGNILTTLLLASELKGHIENPAYYFKDDATAAADLDALMMTQGWTRYNVPAVIKGQIEQPKVDMETGPGISGTVREGFGASAQNVPVTIMAMDSIPFVTTTTTDRQGRFMFNNFEFPDSTKFVIQAADKKGKSRSYELTPDKEKPFPGVSVHLPWAGAKNPELEQYIAKAEVKFTSENGMRTIYIPEVTVTAKKFQRAAAEYSPWSSLLNSAVRPEKYPSIKTTKHLIEQLMKNSNSKITVEMNGSGITMDEAVNLPLFLIEEIELTRPPKVVLLITTKIVNYTPPPKGNIKAVTPFGYQQAKKFYSPKYETREQRENSVPDLRSTIYWNPDITTDEKGEARINFYTADTPGTYSVVIEGITSQGQLIHKIQKINN